MFKILRLFLFSVLAVSSMSLFAPEEMHENQEVSSHEKEEKKQEEEANKAQKEEEEKLRLEKEQKEQEELEREEQEYKEEQEEKNKKEQEATDPDKSPVEEKNTEEADNEEVENTKKIELQKTEEIMRKLAQQGDMKELVNLFMEGKDPVAQALQKVVDISEAMTQQDMVHNFNEAAVLEDVLKDQIASEAPGSGKRVFLEKQLIDVQATQEVWLGRIAKRIQVEVEKTAQNIRKILLKEAPKTAEQKIVEQPTTWWGTVKYGLRSAVDAVAQGVSKTAGKITGKVKEGIDYLVDKVVTKQEVKERQDKVTREYVKLSSRLKSMQENIEEGTTDAQQRLDTLLTTITNLANEGGSIIPDVTQMTKFEEKEDILLTKSRSKVEQIQSELLHAMGHSTSEMESYVGQLKIQGGEGNPIDKILGAVTIKLKVTKSIIDAERIKHIDMAKADAKIVRNLTNIRLIEVDRLLTDGTSNGFEKAKLLLNDSLLNVSTMIEQTEQTIKTLYSKNDKFLSQEELKIRDNNASTLQKELTKLRRRQSDIEIRTKALDLTGKAQELGRQELVRKSGIKELWNRVVSKVNELLFKWGIKDYAVKGISAVDAQILAISKAVRDFSGDVSNNRVDTPRVKEWKQKLLKYSEIYDEISKNYKEFLKGLSIPLKSSELAELRAQLNETKEQLVTMQQEASVILSLAEDVQVIRIATDLQARLVSEAPIIATADGKKIDPEKMKDLLKIDIGTGRAIDEEEFAIKEEDFAKIGFGMVGHDRVYIRRLGDQLLQEKLEESGKVDEDGVSLIAYRQIEAGVEGDKFIGDLQEKWEKQVGDLQEKWEKQVGKEVVEFDSFELGVLRNLLTKGSKAITSWKTKSFDEWTDSEFSQLATYRESQYSDQISAVGGVDTDLAVRKKAARDIGTYGDCASHIIRILKGQENTTPKVSSKSLQEITTNASTTGADMNGELNKQISKYSDADLWLKALEDSVI